MLLLLLFAIAVVAMLSAVSDAVYSDCVVDMSSVVLADAIAFFEGFLVFVQL